MLVLFCMVCLIWDSSNENCCFVVLRASTKVAHGTWWTLLEDDFVKIVFKSGLTVSGKPLTVISPLMATLLQR